MPLKSPYLKCQIIAIRWNFSIQKSENFNIELIGLVYWGLADAEMSLVVAIYNFEAGDLSVTTFKFSVMTFAEFYSLAGKIQ